MGNRIELGTPYNAPSNNSTHLNAAILMPTLVGNQNKNGQIQQKQHLNIEEDFTEMPICESVISCDNLPRDAQNRLPSSRIVCSVRTPGKRCAWREYQRTEVITNSSNPQFLCTIVFRLNFGFSKDTLLRFTVYDVREKISSKKVPIGFAEMTLGFIQKNNRFRMPLLPMSGNCGYITITTLTRAIHKCQQRPPNLTTQDLKSVHGHRRTQSLPSQLGIKLFVPFQWCMKRVFTNPATHTYHLLSDLGLDISVHEVMLESKLCMSIPYQLLTIWIQCERELLQEISGLGELRGEWNSRQMHLLETHFKLLMDYFDAKKNIKKLKDAGIHFKRSSSKADKSLEFIPINLHLQRLWARNDNIPRIRVLDVVTVGAFTRHDFKERKRGGLIKMLQESKLWKLEKNEPCEVQAAYDGLQATKCLRKEILEILSQLISLANCKNSKGMLSLCAAMIAKCKILLKIWEPAFVKEAIVSIEQQGILKESSDQNLTPFRKIIKQLDELDLKLRDLEEFDTPLTASPYLLSRSIKQRHPLVRANSWHLGLSTMATKLDLSMNIKRHRLLERIETFSTTNDAISVGKDKLEKISKLDNCTQYVGKIPITTNNFDFLDVKMMKTSQSSNYYCPSEVSEPLDLTQLNIEASIMCLVSKIKHFCGCYDSPSIQLRKPLEIVEDIDFTSPKEHAPDEIVRTEAVLLKSQSKILEPAQQKNSLQINLIPPNQEASNSQEPLSVTTESLEFASNIDWASELRPSMRKLCHSMDMLLKTAQLVHSVQQLQQSTQYNMLQSEIMYRRDVCFSQALTALVSALMAKLWGDEITKHYLKILFRLGPLAYFEGLLSLYGLETDMWSDMCIAIENLSTVNFSFARSNVEAHSQYNPPIPMPKVTGCRQALEVSLPVPEYIYSMISNETKTNFKITPIFFNIGINEKATIAETLGQTREQHRSNCDNFFLLKDYFSRFQKLNAFTSDEEINPELNLPPTKYQMDLLNLMEEQLRANVSKNVKILHLAEDACRLVSGLRFTSCKSAKDRTGMAVTLEQCRMLVQEFQLPSKNIPLVLNTMRSEGTRIDNVYKNIDKRKYAFNLPQWLALPTMYRPPVGCYGKAET